MTAMSHAGPITPFYTDTYTFYQGGYPAGGALSGTFWIDEMDGDWVISAGDTIRGSLVFSVTNYPDGASYNLVRGFAINSIVGPSLLTGNFSLFGTGGPGNGSMSINPSGGTVTTYEYPLTGAFTVWTTTLAPVITKQVPDPVSTGGILAWAVAGLAILGNKQRRQTRRPQCA